MAFSCPDLPLFLGSINWTLVATICSAFAVVFIAYWLSNKPALHPKFKRAECANLASDKYKNVVSVKMELSNTGKDVFIKKIKINGFVLSQKQTNSWFNIPEKIRNTYPPNECPEKIKLPKYRNLHAFSIVPDKKIDEAGGTLNVIVPSKKSCGKVKVKLYTPVGSCKFIIKGKEVKQIDIESAVGWVM